MRDSTVKYRSLKPLVALGALIVGSLLGGLHAAEPTTDAPAVASLPPLECIRLLRSARIAETAGERENALSALREAADRFPNALIALIELRKFHERHTLPDEERDRLRARLAARLADPELPLPPGTLRQLVGDRELSVEQIEAVRRAATSRLEARPNDLELVEAIASLALRTERWPEARELYGRLLAQDGAMRHRATCISLSRRLERWDDVVELMRPMLEGDQKVAGEDGSGLLLSMGFIEALSKAGRYDELVADLNVLTSQVAENPWAAEPLRALLIEVAWTLHDRGEAAMAESVFRRMLKLDPQDAHARKVVLHLYSDEQEWAEHQRALDEQLADEEDPYALLQRGGELLAANAAQEALELLERAAASLPNEEMAWFNLGMAASRLERWERAAEVLERASELNAGRALTWLNRGAALQNLGRCDEAIVDLERGLELDASLYQTHFYLLMCYSAVGRHEDSAAARRRYDEQRP